LVNFFGQNQPNQGMLSLTSGHHTHTHTHTHTSFRHAMALHVDYSSFC
jgi:hypothetical protein